MKANELNPFPIFDDENAVEESIPFLQDAKKSFGLIPNVEGVMASAPSLLAS